MPTELLLVSGVAFAFVISAVLVLQDHHRKPRQHDAREVVASAVDAGKTAEVAVEPSSSLATDAELAGQRVRLSGGGSLTIDSLLQGVGETTSTSPR